MKFAKMMCFIFIIGSICSLVLKQKVVVHRIKPDSNSSELLMTREELGRNTWTLLHSVAGSYPQVPTEKDKEGIHNMINSLATLYPCQECREHFSKMIRENPVNTNSRTELADYFCKIHNIVNKRLGKEPFDCNKVLTHWGGDCGCTGNKDTEKKSAENGEHEIFK